MSTIQLANASLNSALPPRRQSTIVKRNSIQPLTNESNGSNGHQYHPNGIHRSQSYQENRTNPYRLQNMRADTELVEDGIHPTISNHVGDSRGRINNTVYSTDQVN